VTSPGRLALEALLVLVCGIAAVTDVRTRKIPNALTYTAILAGLVLNGTMRPAGLGWGEAFGGLAIGFVPLFVAYLFGGVGAGDVKLSGAVGAFLGVREGAYALCYTCVAGLAIVAVLFVAREGWSGLWLRVRALGGLGASVRQPRLRFPFAVAVLVGTGWAIAESHLGRSLFAGVLPASLGG
jgi:prepilin peptidase CpaA